MENYLSQKISSIKGVGEARAKELLKLGIETVDDMLHFLPRRLEDRREIKRIAEIEHGETVCVLCTVFSPVLERRIRKGMTIYTLTLQDGTGFLNAVWYNNRFVKNAFSKGDSFLFYGKIEHKYGKKQILSPIYEKEGAEKSMARIVPVYPLSGNLTQKVILNIMEGCLSFLKKESLKETLPEDIRKKYSLAEISYAIQNIHFPKTYEDFAIARRRLVFEEFLLLQMGLRSLHTRRSEQKGIYFAKRDAAPFISALPYPLTGAQRRVVLEIAKDFGGKRPMNRLVQGDVGSGKTAVAAIAMYLCLQNGYQAVMMAPTEILARQHYESLSAMFPHEEICLLTGSMTAKAKREALEKIKTGAVKLVVGTHALIEGGVEFSSLALAITDEQHRFGVRQRAALAAKGQTPHLLVMTATPIPRTLALILYGDLDISVIDEMPPGRQKVDTFVVDESFRARICAFLEKEVLAGHQAYIVCPLVDENEASDLKSVTEYAEGLKTKVFPHIKTEFLHGKMKAKEKDAIMQDFACGNTKILVSTTVIEVGVNVPNATVMVIENAERFGLSQLHQLRGRVGRGKDKSYCILFCQGGGKVTKERMEIMAKTNDGFVIAQKDLELRGPGEFFGTRQHGLPELKIGNLFTDMDILKEAGEACSALLLSDPHLIKEENAPLREALLRMFYQKGSEDMFN